MKARLSPGMSKRKAWAAFSGAARVLVDGPARDDAFWRQLRGSFDAWWRDYCAGRAGSDTGAPRYPCADCGVFRAKAEGGVFTVCDTCWDKHHPSLGDEDAR